MTSSSKILDKLSEEKLSNFNEEMKNIEEFSKIIVNFLINEYEEIFPEILNMPKNKFFMNIKNGAYLNLEDLYTRKIKEDSKFQALLDENFKKIEEKYELNYNFLIKKWEEFKNNKNEEKFLCKYRKHCFNDSEYASHNCTKSNTKFILISNNENNDNIEFVICSNCKKVYKSSFILCKCFHCDEEYYSEIVPKEQNMDLFLATWKDYHCSPLISTKMSCIKCKFPFYLNMKTGMLNCINQKCNFVSKPKRILWSCNNCKKEFRSEAIVYNPLEKEIINKAIKQTLLLKHRAHPSKLPCCKLNIFFTEFYHKKSCKGILYLGEIKDKLVIVCEKCHAINYYERFIWTCPKCQIKFREKNKNPSLSRKSKNSEHEINNLFLDAPNDNNKKEIIEKKEEGDKDERDKDENKEENKEELKEKNNKIDSKLEDKDNKEENEENNDKNDSHKAPIDSPEKKNGNLKIKNSYQSFRFRRQNRPKTDKLKSLDLTHFEENVNNKNLEEKLNENSNSKNDNENKYNGKTSYSRYFKKRRTQLIKGNIPEEINNKLNENQNDKKEEEKQKLIQRLTKLKPTEENFFNRKRSVYMRYKGLKIHNTEIEFNKKENKNKENNEEELEKQYLKTENKSELIDTNEKEKNTKYRGAFSKFLFLGSSKNAEHNESSKNNFLGRNNFRRASMQNPYLNSQIKERISGKKSSSRSSSSSSSSSFSDKMKNITKENEKKDIKINEFKVNNENENNKENNENENNKENSKKSTKVNSKEQEENKIENNNIEEEKDNLDEKEEHDETKGIEVDKNIPNSEEVNSSNSYLQKIPGISDHLLSHLTKRINKILTSSKIGQFNLEDYTFSRRLGEGSYGVIHCLINEKTKEKFALKKIIAYSLNKIQEFTKEFELVHICQHPNILKIYGLNINILDQTTYSLQVLMEKADRDWDRDIRRRLQERRYYTEEELISIMRQLTSALLFMEEKLNITHRDIKPQNVLIFEGGIYKLADFGEAKEIKVMKNLNTLRGTELYMSPALYNGLKINKDDVDHDPFKSDLFSLGFCLVYAATMNFNLLYELRNVNSDEKIIKRIKDNLKENYSEKFIEIISKMVKLDEKKRFDFKELSIEIEKYYGK